MRNENRGLDPGGVDVRVCPVDLHSHGSSPAFLIAVSVVGVDRRSASQEK